MCVFEREREREGVGGFKDKPLSETCAEKLVTAGEMLTVSRLTSNRTWP